MITHFKRSCALLLAGGLAVTACGDDDDAADSSPAATAEASSEATEPTSTESAGSESAGTDSSTAPSETEPPDAASTVAPAGRPVVKVGSVNSLSGPATFPEASAAAQAVFDHYNADPNGLVTIEYIAEDDGVDPALAAQATRKLVTDAGVALLAGAASVVDCAVNGTFYAENNLYSVQGTGVDPTCFTQPNISPVNTGPYTGITVTLQYASETLGHESICYFQFDAGLGPEPYQASIDRWTAITGKQLTTFEFYTPGEDFGTYVTRAGELGCTAVLEVGLDVTAIAWNAAATGAEFETLHLTSAYSQAAADGIGAPSTPTYANSEFEPFSDTDSPALADWAALMDEAGVAKTSFAQGGYLSGLIAIQILETAGLAEGDDLAAQRDKIAAAVLAFEPFEHPMLGTLYEFGDKPAHNSNQASKIVGFVDGQWVTVTDEFIVLTDLG